MCAATSLQISSPSFKENEMIPSTFTCEGDSINPAISVKNIPQQTKSLALIMEDPDATRGTFDHWIMWNIDPNGEIGEGSAPGNQGKNGYGKKEYAGPCPPTGTHHYHFRIFALDTELELNDGANKTQLEDAMMGHILAEGELVGLYKKAKQ